MQAPTQGVTQVPMQGLVQAQIQGPNQVPSQINMDVNPAEPIGKVSHGLIFQIWSAKLILCNYIDKFGHSRRKGAIRATNICMYSIS